MLSRIATGLFGLATVAVVAAVCFFLHHSIEEIPGEETVGVEDATRELTESVVVDQEHTVDFRIINGSKRLIRVIGSEYT